MNRSLVRALRDFVDYFDDSGFDYAVMGGLAARVLGIPRPTYDIDFTVAVSRDDLSTLFDAAENMGYHVPVAYRSGWVDSLADMPIVKLGMQLGERPPITNVRSAKLSSKPAIQHHAVSGRSCRPSVQLPPPRWPA